MFHLCHCRTSKKGSTKFSHKNCLPWGLWATQLGPKTQGPILHATKLRRSCTQQHSLPNESTSCTKNTAKLTSYGWLRKQWAVICSNQSYVSSVIFSVLLGVDGHPCNPTQTNHRAVARGKRLGEACYCLKETSEQQFNNYNPSPIYLPEVQLKVPGGVFLETGVPMRSLWILSIEVGSFESFHEFPHCPQKMCQWMPWSSKKRPRKNASSWKTAMHPFLHPGSVMIALWISWQAAEDEDGKAQDLDKFDLFRKYRKNTWKLKTCCFLTMPVANTSYNMLQP